ASRNPLTSRLHSLFSSQQPRKDSQQDTDMRPPRATCAPGPAGARAGSGSRRHSRPQSLTLSLAGSSYMQTQSSERPHPVLRWMSGKHSSSKSLSSSPAPSPTHSSPIDTPTSSVASTPSSAASALADAFSDNPLLASAHHSAFNESSSSLVSLPTRPEAARLPPHFQATRPPRYLSELTRSTLPSASLSPPLHPYDDAAFQNPVRYTDPFAPDQHDSDMERNLDILYSPTPMPLAIPHSPAPAHLGRQRSGTMSTSSTRSSLDTLRIHTASPPQLKISLLPDSLKNWFGGEESVDSKAMHNMLSEEDQQSSRQAEREHIKKKCRLWSEEPVVFCHGLLGFDTVTVGPSIASLQVTHWRGIKEAFEANGVEVLMTRVPATSTPIDRAKVLCEKVSEAYPGRSVHLIGLDCRYLTTHLTDRPFKFNKDTPDVPGVKYFSWGATYDPGLIDTWKWPHSVVMEKEGPNDGLVSLKSARWGTYLGTLEGVNHLDLIGWVNTARYKWAEIMGREVKFKPVTFYLGIADHLARVRSDEGRAPSEERRGETSEEREEREEIQKEGERAEMADSLGKGDALVREGSEPVERGAEGHSEGR
ncbi:uncharacterized protein B0H18DRAFT_969715, partial [Fomitopsis serialis]|uniref:uncharacterized protein n=1 Tax=Fomitopsis serialis TaxID=139415 RepID=UPI002007B13C